MPSLRTKAVHKVLHSDTLRSAAENSWSKHSSEIQNFDILTRCRKLNQFLAQGLLSEVIQEEAPVSPPLEGNPAKVQQAQGVGSHHKGRTPGSSGQGGILSSHKGSPNSSCRQPLTDRITSNEFAALLELLAEQEPHQLDCAAGSEPTIATTSRAVAATTLPTARDVDCQVSPPESSAEEQRSPACEADDFDVIGLVNSSSAGTSDIRTVLQQLYAEQHEQAALCVQCAFRCKQACQQLQLMQQAAPCVSLLDPSQQASKGDSNHLRQLASDHKQNSISSAWRGYYGYWGADAACTIQQHWRSYVTRNQYKQLQGAAVVLQALVRGWVLRHSSDNPIPVHRQHQQKRLEQQLKQEQLRQERQVAAVVLQCCIRGRLARKQLCTEREAVTYGQVTAETQETCLTPRYQHVGHEGEGGEESSAAVVADVGPAEIIIPSNPDISSTSSPTLCFSNHSIPGSSSDDLGDQSGSRQALSADHGLHDIGIESKQVHRQRSSNNNSGGHSSCQSSVRESSKQKQHQHLSERPRTCGVGCVQQRASDDSDSCGAATVADALQARQLIIRSATDTRTANQHRDPYHTADSIADDLTAEFIQRAAELSVGEDLQQVDLSVRTTMARSSFRGLREAMLVVKSKTYVL